MKLVARNGLLALIAVVAIVGSYLIFSPSSAPSLERLVTNADTALLMGSWNTQKVAQNNDLNGAYTGSITFGDDYYQVQNDAVVQPIRIDNVVYSAHGNQIEAFVRGQPENSSVITLLDEKTATVKLGPGDQLTLFMYKR